MRIITANSYEFEHPSSEQAVAIAAATSQEFKDIRQFLAECPEISRTDIENWPPSNSRRPRESMVSKYLSTYLGRGIPPGAEIFVLIDDWNEFEFVATTAQHYLWYRWDTSA